MVQNDVFSVLFKAINTPFRAIGFSNASSFLALMTINWVTMNQDQDRIASTTEEQSQTTFDFIVVGAGTTGAVVAHRLSENGKYSVLLLEAGGAPPPSTIYPLLAPFNVHLETDWGYKTVPQKNSCFGVKDQRMRWPRGKLLGGTSTLNWMLYVRGHPMDFNRWADLSEDEQWNYENLLPYFKKLENYKGNFKKSKTYHSKSGPFCVSKHHEPPLISTWLQAGKEIGYFTGTDYNAYQKPGFYPLDVTICKGRRVSTYTSYIIPAKDRANLKIYSFAHVTRIDIDDATKKATGVTYHRHGSTKQAFANKEVIISAGAIGTTQLLMLSGIGPEAHLKSFGITPKVDSPGVGQNLQDHVMLFFGPFVLNDSVSVMCKRNITLEAANEYKNNKTGYFAYNFVSGAAFFNSSKAAKLPDGNSWSDAVLMLGTGSMEDEDDGDTFAGFLGVEKEINREYIRPFTGKDAVWVLMTVGLPKTRGTIELASKDPFTHPNIDPKYFDKPEDMKVFVETMQFVVDYFEKTEAWQKYNATFAPGHKLAACQQYPEKSDSYFECFARTLTMTQWHPCCTAKFGKPGDPLAVLNSNLSVNGIEGLRVADASVMPVIPNANLNAPCIMIGEKVAQLILDDWIKKEVDGEKAKEKPKSTTLPLPLLPLPEPFISTLGKFRPMEALEALVKELFR